MWALCFRNKTCVRWFCFPRRSEAMCFQKIIFSAYGFRSGKWPEDFGFHVCNFPVKTVPKSYRVRTIRMLRSSRGHAIIRDRSSGTSATQCRQHFSTPHSPTTPFVHDTRAQNGSPRRDDVETPASACGQSRRRSRRERWRDRRRSYVTTVLSILRFRRDRVQNSPRKFFLAETLSRAPETSRWPMNTVRT